MVLDFLAVDNIDFTRKIVKKKKLGEKLVKMLNFDFDFSNSVISIVVILVQVFL